MKILYLGHADSPLISYLKSDQNEVVQTLEKLNFEEVKRSGFDFLVSYSYRHIIKKDLLDLFPSRAINLHISFLPWNRGADPNLWSFVENTPKGVSIHHLDEGVDTGDIIAQRRVEFNASQETLASSYAKLHREIQNLFYEVWPAIKSGTAPRIKQPEGGSSHKASEKKLVLGPQGWETPVSALKKKS